MSEEDLQILNQNLDLVGNRELPKEQLEEFIRQTLRHDVKESTLRRKMFDDKELEHEMDINNFPFYTDGYRTGIFIKLVPDNIWIQRDDEGNEIQVRQLYKKKDGEYIYDDEGEMIPTDRCLMRIKGRRGFMGVFIGLKKVNAINEGNFYVFVGDLTTQYKVANSENDYHKKKEDGVEYTDIPSFTVNVWQIGELKKTKGGKLKVILPDCNWEEKKAKTT